MLRIRLIRTGKKNAAAFRLVLTEKTAPPQGKFLEVLGHYNPRLKEVKLNAEKIKYWLSKGAQASVTVHNLLVSQGVVKGPKIKKKIKVKQKAAATEEKTADKEEAIKEETKETAAKEESKEKPKEEKKPETKETKEAKPQSDQKTKKEEKK